MTFSRVFRVFFVIALLLTVAAAPALAQGQGRISGRVVDENGDGLAGAQVVAETPGRPPAEATTDEDGRFQMLGFPSGPYTVTATLDGYQPANVTLRVTQGPPARGDISLVRVRSGFELLVGEEALEGLDADALEADLQAADAAFDAQDFDTAIAGYRDLLAVLPSLNYLYLNIGNAYRAQEEYEMALEAYNTLSEDPQHGEQARNEIARTRLAMGDLDAAANLSTGLNASREDLYNLGEVDFAKGDIDAAAGWYEKAAAASPDWEKPWFKLALVALNKGDMETAKTNFQKVIDLAPNSEEATQAQATLSALP